MRRPFRVPASLSSKSKLKPAFVLFVFRPIKGLWRAQTSRSLAQANASRTVEAAELPNRDTGRARAALLRPRSREAWVLKH